MTLPGTRILHCASRLLPPDVVARLVTPTVADMQWDVDAACRSGDRQARYAALVRGYGSLLRLVPVLILHTSRHVTHEFLSDDDQALRRVVTCSAGAVLFCTLLLTLPVYPGLRRMTAELVPSFVLLVIPQALGVALPVGFLIGSLIGLRARGPNGRTLRRLLIGAGMVVLLTLATIEWLVPLANQRFRELMISDAMARGVARTAIHVEKGPNERSLRELYDGRAQFRHGETRESLALSFSFHSRLALILSPVAFALLAFGVVSIGRGRWLAVAAAIGLVAAVIVLVWFDGPADDWPPLLRAYTPDLIFGILGAVLLWCSFKWPDRRQPLDSPAPALARDRPIASDRNRGLQP